MTFFFYLCGLLNLWKILNQNMYRKHCDQKDRSLLYGSLFGINGRKRYLLSKITFHHKTSSSSANDLWFWCFDCSYTQIWTKGGKNSKLAHTNFTNRVNWDGLLSTGKKWKNSTFQLLIGNPPWFLSFFFFFTDRHWSSPTAPINLSSSVVRVQHSSLWVVFWKRAERWQGSTFLWN